MIRRVTAELWKALSPVAVPPNPVEYTLAHVVPDVAQRAVQKQPRQRRPQDAPPLDLRQACSLHSLRRPVTHGIDQPARAGLDEHGIVPEHRQVAQPVVDRHPQEELGRGPPPGNLLQALRGVRDVFKNCR